ncbi:717_t:CDS:2, partial [Dentiscutata heterogama]
NSLQSLQEFLLLNYSQDELQEYLINVEDMISSDDEKEHDNDSMFNLEQSLYDNKKTGDDYTEKIPAIKTKQTTPCVIIDNYYGEIRHCNRESAKELRELISVWEIDKDT